MTGAGFLNFAAQLSLLLILLGMAVAFVRLAKGPSLADRVVALDMMTVTIISFCGVYAVFMDEPSFLDVAIVLALVGFLATVALARYAERRFELDETEQKHAKQKEQDT
ncbi:monovalent cation/H+ antiporter complex subunit F [Roseinatronobacter monicus]|uniref:Multisubunit sodium/proton antiporter MrpF subunit n=1 Tax=Roseinatronobacter monicus TaxID=393481 RepID=A0A543KAW5_9RHOB|nr:cation:proton antiporter [Roseinatronobacter monicus]TQM92228.1 multisubunit sodium/proton antiporter MrpF subunit [Roseinatronobacter monicus]